MIEGVSSLVDAKLNEAIAAYVEKHAQAREDAAKKMAEHRAHIMSIADKERDAFMECLREKSRLEMCALCAI